MKIQQIKSYRLGRGRERSCGSGEQSILSGKVVCAGCGRVFIRKKEQKRQGVVIKWRCPGHRSETCRCFSNEIWEEDIQKAFVNAFNTLEACADELVSPIIKGMKRIQEANGFHDASIAFNQKKLELKEQRHILRQLNADECIDSALYFEESGKIERELSRCRLEERQLHSNSVYRDKIADLQSTLQQIQTYGGRMQKFDSDQFITMVRMITVEKDKVLGYELRCGLKLYEPVM